MKKWIDGARNVGLCALCIAAAACASEDAQDSGGSAASGAAQPAGPTAPAAPAMGATGATSQDTATGAEASAPMDGAAGAPAPEPATGTDPAATPPAEQPADDGASAEADAMTDGTPNPADEPAQEPPGDSADPGEAMAATDTWGNFAEGFVDTYCIGCHPSLLSQRDYNSYANIVTDADAIRCGVAPTMLDGCSGNPAPGQFPAGAPYPTDEERLRLVAWIEAGMPE